MAVIKSGIYHTTALFYLAKSGPNCDLAVNVPFGFTYVAGLARVRTISRVQIVSNWLTNIEGCFWKCSKEVVFFLFYLCLFNSLSPVMALPHCQWLFCEM